MGVATAAEGEHDSQQRADARPDPPPDAGNGRGRRLAAAVARDLRTVQGRHRPQTHRCLSSML